MPATSPAPSRENIPPHMLKAPPTNKLLESVIRSPNRTPSPQPTHLGIPGQPHKVLQEEGSGYVAPKFEGKSEQMEK
jgi:glutamate dehydrogenase